MNQREKQRQLLLVEFINEVLPIDENGYKQLWTGGINGFQLSNGFHGNIASLHKNRIPVVASLAGDTPSEIIKELNHLANHRQG